MKEAKRRREWGAGKSDLHVAGLPWPTFPRNSIAKVLGDVLKEVTRIDQEGMGIFSQPVPRDVFPDYYELIKKPMDYGTMKEKLDRGEYRSTQQMQKDFLLVMQNCLQYNTADSDIVAEARRQTLMRPKILKEAALKNNLFIGDDGAVVDIHNEKEETKKGGKGKKKSKRKMSIK